MLKQHSIDDSRKNGQNSAPGTDRQAISFGPDTIVAGIVFHLADEGVGNTVDPTSLASLRRRLKRSREVAIIKRSRWESMSNPQRLEWLLAVSESCYQVRDDATIGIGHR